MIMLSLPGERLGLVEAVAGDVVELRMVPFGVMEDDQVRAADARSRMPRGRRSPLAGRHDPERLGRPVAARERLAPTLEGPLALSGVAASGIGDDRLHADGNRAAL